MFYYARTGMELLMARKKLRKSYIECVGGPFDGRRFFEVDTGEQIELASDVRVIEGRHYVPVERRGGVLYIRYVTEEEFDEQSQEEAEGHGRDADPQG